ncbi:MAG: hypothetical protein AABY22_25670 [Nanoarchaeota archaeon]
MDENKRFEINKRLIGKVIFVITFGGWYGQVIQVNGDECQVKYNNYIRKVNIWDVRDPQYSV